MKGELIDDSTVNLNSELIFDELAGPHCKLNKILIITHRDAVV